MRVIRHRIFEFSYHYQILGSNHAEHTSRVAGYRHGQLYEGDYVAVYGDGGGKGSLKDWQDAMEMPWVSTRKGIAEAVPPAYTRFIGNHLQELMKG